MNFIDRYHIVRRVLLFFFTYFYLKIADHIFCGGGILDVFKVSAFGIFTSVEVLFIKYYLKSRDLEIKK